MASSNGGVKAILIVFGVITAIIVPAMFFMGTNVIANDKENTDDHKEIRESIAEFSIEQMRQGTILERIDKKL